MRRLHHEGDDPADEAAVNGHAPVPDLELVPRVLCCPEGEPVNEYLTYPSTQHAAGHREDDQRR